MDFADYFHILLRISCWTSVGASILRLCSLYQIYRKGPSVPGPMQPLSTIHHHRFVLVAFIHGVAILCVALGLGVTSKVEYGSRPLTVSGSVVLLGMAGQCFWMGGSWYLTRRAFHPLILACVLVLCFSVSLVGILLMENPTLGCAILVTGASMFRIFMVTQWIVFIWEARGTEGRPGGNTLRNTPGIYKLTGHLSIQILSTGAMILACAMIWNKANASDNRPILKLAIPSITSAAYALHDGCTETLVWINRLFQALRQWWMKGPIASSDGLELLDRGSDEGHRGTLDC
ncbi:hypothetical protein EV126DRAFT_177878 [Verticillium dahliae]|nr:hypothetical protein EV126DRAFT_177878 [Verticillium dahliae]